MKRASVLLFVAAVVGLAMPAWADHSTPRGVNCSNFDFQEDAQAYFEAHPGDPEGLDGPIGPTPDGIPNVACENLPRRGTGTTTSVATVPPTTTTTLGEGRHVDPPATRCVRTSYDTSVCTDDPNTVLPPGISDEELAHQLQRLEQAYRQPTTTTVVPRTATVAPRTQAGHIALTG